MANQNIDHAFTARSKTGAAFEPTYAGALSFMRRKYTKDVKGADAVVALAGSDNTLPAAQTLVGGGIAPTLVVSAERNGNDKARARACRAKSIPTATCRC